MPISPSKLALVAGIGGGFSGIPWLLRQQWGSTNDKPIVQVTQHSETSADSRTEQNTSGESLPESPIKDQQEVPPADEPEVVPSVPVVPEVKEMSGNCEIIKAKASFDGDAGSTENEKTLGDAIWNACQEIDHYLSVICKKANEGEDSKFPSDWADSFPNNLFPRRETLTVGNKLDIKMQVTTGEENSGDYRKIVFTGKAFESDIEGEWNGEVQIVGYKFDKPVNVVNVTKPTSSLNKIFVSQLV